MPGVTPFAFIPQSARGDIIVAQVTGGTPALLDLDPSSPGVNGSRRSPPANETKTSASSVTHAGLASTL